MKKDFKEKNRILLLLFVVLFFGCEEKDITNILAQQLTIDLTEVTLDPGETKQLSATVLPENAGNTAVFWMSKNTKIATVENGIITAVSPGATTIVAISYSNSDVRGEVAVTVTGVPEDLATAVAGMYIGEVKMGDIVLASDVEATLTAADNKVRLATDAVTGMGALAMDIEVDVSRNGDGYTISGSGMSTMGRVAVSGTIDASGNMTLTIALADAGITVIYTAKKGKTAIDAIAGIYIGIVNSVATGEISEVEVALTPDGGKVKLATTVETPAGTLVMDIPMTASRNREDFAISGSGESTFGPVSISGTVNANGIIDLTIILHGYGDLPVSYIGQKKENLSKLVAGTYLGQVSFMGTPVTANDVAMILTAVNDNILHWETHVAVPALGGSLDVTDFEVAVSRSGSDFAIAGSGTTSVGPLTLSGTIDAAGLVTVNLNGPGLPGPLVYTGQKQ